VTGVQSVARRDLVFVDEAHPPIETRISQWRRDIT
jgi:hypothetical protein